MQIDQARTLSDLDAFHAVQGLSNQSTRQSVVHAQSTRMTRQSRYSIRVSRTSRMSNFSDQKAKTDLQDESAGVPASALLVLLIRQQRVARRFKAFAAKRAEERAAAEKSLAAAAAAATEKSSSHADFAGVWGLCGSEHFDDYLKVAGVNYVKRKLANGLKPVQSWELQNGTWQFTVQAPWGPKVEDFPIGVVVEEDLFDSRWEKVSEWEGSVLVTTINEMRGSNPRRTVLRRYRKGDKLVLEMALNGVVCYRIFSRQ